ncbi:MAG TPA: DEAD/DEAH box helicase [Xanthobacteraceae bacterium]|jgi:ATP-dependent RNA helicase RhlE|nr:DEAD/DEAH box helicase [Xanthobacteraceae bacterium]
MRRFRPRAAGDLAEWKVNFLNSFEAFGLAEPITRALAQENYVTPTPIQAQTIPVAMRGRDVVGIAQTGTGKTAAFALPILHELSINRRPPERKSCRVLVLSPTRELSGQILDSFNTYGRHLRVGTALAIGGVSIGGQVRALQDGVDVLVATPGRLLDLVQSHALRLDRVEVLVLDEADRMLDMGFIHDIRKIVAKLPAKRQTLFFSATMPRAIAELAGQMLRDPVRVAVAPPATTVELVDQRIIHLDRAAKPAALAELLRREPIDRALVFTRTKHGADKVVRSLAKAGIAAQAIHGNKSQPQRERVLAAFRAGRVSTLIATDIAARGIDVDGISHVVNYDLPNIPESYVHRIGRTARAGAAGIAISFCDADEVPFLRDIEKLIRASIPATDQRSSRPAAKHAQGARPIPSRAPREPARDHNARPAQKTRAGSDRAPERVAPAPQPKHRRRRGAQAGQHQLTNGHSQRRHDPTNLATMPFLQPAARPQPRTAPPTRSIAAKE